MPTYDYECKNCGFKKEVFHGIKEKHEETCPECGKEKLSKIFSSGVSIHFKCDVPGVCIREGREY